uniref:F-box associated domain-containing protein n=1 Tax=Oryza punctata TaxID=4537 RepID=A0A0E0KH41_ORYPU
MTTFAIDHTCFLIGYKAMGGSTICERRGSCGHHRPPTETSEIWRIRLSLSDGKYRVIKLLPTIDLSYYQSFYFGKSEKWAGWILKHQNGLKPLLPSWKYCQQVHGPWVLRDVNYNFIVKNLRDDGSIKLTDISLEENNEALFEDKFEWYSDNDDVVEAQRGGEHENHEISILGFHPYKEIIGLAYHLNSSKLQNIRHLYPKNYDQMTEGLDGYITKDKFEWYSDNNDVIEAQGGGEHENHEISILGFHPYKEIIFLSLSLKIGLAYRLNSSKLQDIGHLYQKNMIKCGKDWIGT